MHVQCKRQGDVPAGPKESREINMAYACLLYERHALTLTRLEGARCSAGTFALGTEFVQTHVRSLHFLFLLAPSCGYHTTTTTMS